MVCTVAADVKWKFCLEESCFYGEWASDWRLFFFFDYLGWFLFGHEAFGARFKMNGSFWVYN
jgi:hypothetical protein